ncbi:hypothetical protein ACI2IY_18090 [Lysobacter enzymogenes]|uniref:hypothetical protein n=1 Tax=Lysobacter enzymogenes TaxID=69 RepID=UPI00384B62C9
MLAILVRAATQGRTRRGRRENADRIAKLAIANEIQTGLSEPSRVLALHRACVLLRDRLPINEFDTHSAAARTQRVALRYETTRID